MEHKRQGPTAVAEALLMAGEGEDGPSTGRPKGGAAGMQPGAPKFRHYRRRKTNKAPRKRTFIMHMTKYPDNWMASGARAGSDGGGGGGGGGGSLLAVDGAGAGPLQPGVGQAGGRPSSGFAFFPNNTLYMKHQPQLLLHDAAPAMSAAEVLLPVLSLVHQLLVKVATAAMCSVAQAVALKHAGRGRARAASQAAVRLPSSCAAAAASKRPRSSPFACFAAQALTVGAIGSSQDGSAVAAGSPLGLSPVSSVTSLLQPPRLQPLFPAAALGGGLACVPAGAVSECMLPSEDSGSKRQRLDMTSAFAVVDGMPHSSSGPIASTAGQDQLSSHSDVVSEKGSDVLRSMSWNLGQESDSPLASGVSAGVGRAGSWARRRTATPFTIPLGERFVPRIPGAHPAWLPLPGSGSAASAAHGASMPPRATVLCQHLVSAGAYGNVYRGRLAGGGVVAVKLMNEPAPSDALNMADVLSSFRTEMEVLARVVHPNIMAARHMQLADGPVCIVQDFANWGTLTDYILQRPGRQWMELESLVLARVAAEAGLELWTLEQSLQQHDEGGPADRFCGLSARRYMVLLALLRDVAQGLAYLDEQAIVHRDLKPENVLINDMGVAQLSDFGLALIVGAPSASPGGDGGHANEFVSTQSLAVDPASGAESSVGGLVVSMLPEGDAMHALHDRSMADEEDDEERMAALLGGAGSYEDEQQQPQQLQDPQATVQYSAPEDLWSSRFVVGTRADVYSFGVVLWEALSGVAPWQAMAPATVIYSVGQQGQRLAVPQSWAPRVRSLLSGAFQADPASRPSAGVLQAELTAEIHTVLGWVGGTVTMTL